MIRPVILFIALFGLLVSANAQEDKVSAAAIVFFKAFQKGDSLALSREFVDPVTFFHYFSRSYTLGSVNDTLKKSIESSRRGLYESWIHDVMVCRKKAASVFKIRWEEIQDTEYRINYLERSSAGFLFKSYELTIHFRYKKKQFQLLLDSYIFEDNHPAILANSCLLSEVH